MNNQEVFNEVWNGLKSQGWQKSSDRGSYYYRHPNGRLKCAIGHLIPDEEYRPEFEGKSAHYLMNSRQLKCLEGMDLDFLECLQGLHDSIFKSSPAEMEEKFRNFAEIKELTIPE